MENMGTSKFCKACGEKTPHTTFPVGDRKVCDFCMARETFTEREKKNDKI